MANYLQYNDPIKIQWRRGDDTDPYVDKVQSQKVINNTIALDEIPDEFYHVSIAGYVEIYDAVPTSANQFVVNYANGFVTFHPSAEGSTVTATYKGRGEILYPAERIILHNENPDIVVSVQELFDDAHDVLQNITQYAAQASGYTHNQVASSTLWSIAHNLNKFPSVNIVDSGGNTVIGEVKYVSNNLVEVRFSAGFSGKAYLS